MKTLQKRKLKTENRVRMEKVFNCEACNARKKGTSNLAEAALIGRYRYLQTHSVHSVKNGSAEITEP